MFLNCSESFVDEQWSLKKVFKFDFKCEHAPSDEFTNCCRVVWKLSFIFKNCLKNTGCGEFQVGKLEL